MVKKKSTKSDGLTTRMPNSTLKERTLVIGSGATVVQFGGSQPLRRTAHLAAAGIAGGGVVDDRARRRRDRRGQQRRPLRAAGAGVAHARVAHERQDVDEHEVLHRHRAGVLHPQAVLERAAVSVPAEVETGAAVAGPLDRLAGDELGDARHGGGAGGAAEGLGRVAVAVEVEGVGLGRAGAAQDEAGGVLSRFTSLDRLPNGAPLRIVVLRWIHTSWPTPRLPLPAFHCQRSSVRPVPAKFGICSKTLGRRQAGAPVVERPGDEDEVDRQQIGHHHVFQGDRIAGPRVAAHEQAQGYRLARVERSAAGEVVLQG